MSSSRPPSISPTIHSSGTPARYASVAGCPPRRFPPKPGPGWVARTKLNAAVWAATATYHWPTITVPASAFYHHGDCRFRQSWVVPVTHAYCKNLGGAFLPTVRSAHSTAMQALRLLCPLLNDKEAQHHTVITPGFRRTTGLHPGRQ